MSILTQEKASIASATKVREGLQQLRELCIKNYAMKKYMKVGDITSKCHLNGQQIVWIEEVGAIENCSEAGTTMRDGKLFKWTYQGTETGVVDGKLVDQIIQKKRDYDTNWRKEKRNATIELQTIQIAENRGQVKLPSTKKDNVDQIIGWINAEIAKNEQVPGYLRAQEAVMLPRIKEVLTGLSELREVIAKIHL